MQIIQNWINSKQHFLIGKMLYMQFGTDQDFKKLLVSKGETPFNKQKLLQQLTQIASGTESKPQKAIIKAETHKVMPDGETPLLQALNKEWKPLYQRMNYLRHRLQEHGTDNTHVTMLTCKPICAEILSLEQQCMHIWTKRDYVLKHGRLPDLQPKEQAFPTDPLALGRLVENCKRQIRRHRVNANKYPEEPRYVQLLEDWKTKYKKATGKEYQEKPTA